MLNSPYLRLMRLHQPTGIWLLLWPCWWGIALASEHWPSVYLLVLFAIGAVLMRSAGCIINDIIDRDIDKQVERTRNRPLASGELSVKQAAALMILLMAGAGIIALLLGKAVLLWSMSSLALVATYPFMKRISWWPQLFLGFTFNWGALMGWVAVRGEVNLPAAALYVAGIFWTLGYDTLYAHQDKCDDARIGVKSTALRLGVKTKRVVGLFYVLTTLSLAVSGWLSGASIGMFAGLALVQLHFGWQLCNVDLDSPDSCRRIFISNARLGCIVFACIIMGKF